MNRKNGPPASLSAKRAFLTFEYNVLNIELKFFMSKKCSVEIFFHN
jgi:hypothetical protein